MLKIHISNVIIYPNIYMTEPHMEKKYNKAEMSGYQGLFREFI